MNDRKTILDNGKFKQVGKNTSVDYYLPSGADTLSSASNLIPNISGVSGGRVLLGTKANLQALSLVHREEPLVQSTIHHDHDSFETTYGKNLAAVVSPVDGTVTKIDDHSIFIKDKKGVKHHIELYHNFPSGKKSFLHNTPTVKEGDEVKKGALLASSNFTTDKGVLALGVNLNTAIMPYRSSNFEDSFVVTESGAKKLKSEQMVTVRLDRRLGVDTKKSFYISIFSNKFVNSQLATIDEDGVVKKGTILKYNDPIILAYAPKSLKTLDMHLGKLSKAMSHAYKDLTEIWDFECDGLVTDVAKQGTLLTVSVKFQRDLHIGDKVSIYSGNKGVTGYIIPDHLAPTTKDGKPVDALLNSMSVVSRVSPAMLSNLAFGKIAQKQGKPIKVTGFSEGNIAQQAHAALKEHGLEDVEELYDPVSGTNIKALLGPLFFNKLVHIAEDKVSDRSQGVGYDWNCLSADTEVLTDSGWKFCKNVTDSDKLLTLKEDRWVYIKPTQIIKKKWTGKMYGYESKYINYLVTPDHRIYYTDPSSQFSFKFKEAAQLINKKFNIKQFGPCFEGNKQGTVVVGDKVIDEKLYAQLVGWWLSEGSVVVNNSSHEYKVYIFQSKKANLEKFQEIEMLLKDIGLNYFIYNKYEEPNGFGICGKEFAQYFLNNFGKYCYNKRVPRFIFSLSIEARKELLLAAIKGDGSDYIHDKHKKVRTKPNRIIQYFTVNKGLADDIQELCISVGWGAFIRKKIQKNRLYYSLGITKERINSTVNKHNHYIIDYDDYVYCAHIPETGLLYIRRNDKPMLIGNCQPAKAKNDSSKRLGNLSTTALLSHNATKVLKDIATIRSTKNDEFWLNLKLGLPAPPPKVPFIFNKFISALNGSGIKVNRNNNSFQILPQTDKDIEAMSSGEVANPKTFKVKGQNLIAEKGGLFDPVNIGILGDKYNHVNLNYPVPNPISEDFIRRLFKMTKQQYQEAIVSGDISRKLNTLNVDAKIAEYKQYIKQGKVSERSNALKLLTFLTTLKEHNIHPKELLLSKIPIIPAQFRPIQVAGDLTLSADVNHLYKDLMLNNDHLKHLEHIPEDIANKAKLAQYQAVKAIYGLGEPISIKHKEKNIKGLLADMLGTHGGSAKGSMFQANVVNKPLDLISRGVATGDVKLHLDELSMPADIAWKIFSPFLMRRLIKRGVPAVQAVEYVKTRHPLAAQVLHEEMADRPVTMSRDPALHKFNVMGFMSKINPDPKNKTISVNPLVFKGFNLDLDGDAISVGLPAGDDAKQEIKDKMLPSKNLLSVRSFSPIYTPSNEAALGLYQLSTVDNKNKPVKFNTEHDAINAFHKGEISAGTRVTIGK